ncbi:MAG: pyridoxamine 5'-phosphate oxidase family protein, partial [Myxococcota bacterium]
VVETRPADLEADVAPMARRYFGEELGNAYAKATGAEGQTVYVMRPERWRTVDYAQLTSE